MSKTYITSSLRSKVTELAQNRCEYCLTPATVAVYSMQIDHIIPEKQGGPTLIEKLALACRPCNVNKGYTVVKYYYATDETLRLYHPRKHVWNEHFSLLPTGMIVGKTDTAKATIDVLHLNERTRVEDRMALIELSLLQPVD